MGSFSSYVENIKNASVTIFEGMAVTLSWMFRRPMTLQYPDKTERPVKDMLPVRFRGLLEVDISACTACAACMRACPIDVILVETQKVPGGKGRYLTRFDIDASKCMYCGLCTEGCPIGCLRHSSEFETTNRDIRNLILHFVDEPVVPFKQKKGEPKPVFPPLGENARKVINAWDAKYTQWAPGPLPEPPPAPAEKKEQAPSAKKTVGDADTKAKSADAKAEKGDAKPKVSPDAKAKSADAKAESADAKVEKGVAKPEVSPDAAKTAAKEPESSPKAAAQSEATETKDATEGDKAGVEASAEKTQPTPVAVDKPEEGSQGSEKKETTDTPSVDEKSG